MTREDVIYENGEVQITNKRVVIGATTYALPNITSVRSLVIPADRSMGILLLISGICAAGLGALIGLFGITGLLDNADPSGLFCAALFLVPGVGAAFFGALLMYQAKEMYTMVLATSGVEVRALTSYDWGFIQRIVIAVNKAMVLRT